MQFDRWPEQILKNQSCFSQQGSNWIKAGIRLERQHDTWCQQMERRETVASEVEQLTDKPFLQLLDTVHLEDRRTVLVGTCHHLNKQTNNQFPSSLSRTETSKLLGWRTKDIWFSFPIKHLSKLKKQKCNGEVLLNAIHYWITRSSKWIYIHYWIWWI